MPSLISPSAIAASRISAYLDGSSRIFSKKKINSSRSSGTIGCCANCSSIMSTALENCGSLLANWVISALFISTTPSRR